MPPSRATSTRRYKGRTSEQLREERRERLLTAALELYSEKGYANTPIETLCSTAKVTTRHFYEQFKGKEELLAALFRHLVSEASDVIRTSLQDESLETPKQISHALRGFAHYMLEDPRRARIICLESVGVSASMERMRRKLVHAFARLISDYANSLAADGFLPERDYSMSAVAIVGAINELLVEWLVTDTGMSVDDLATEMVILFQALVQGASQFAPRSK